MGICVIYSSPKLGDIILQLPFLKAISDKYNKKIIVCINKYISIKEILEDQDYIDCVIENAFRKGRFFFYDVIKLVNNLKKKKISTIFIFEKTKGPAIAAKLAGVKEIYGFGIGFQKYFVDRSVSLKKNDLRYNYSHQSEKFLNKLNIITKYDQTFLNLKSNIKEDFFLKYQKLPKPWVCFAVDSTEVNRIWPQKNFAELADKLIRANLAKTIFVINHENHKNYFHEIVKNSNYKNNFINCKILNRHQIIHLINISKFFIGIDSGPSCVAGALGKKTFCIIGPTDATLPRFISMKKIISDIYDQKREIGINRCGDNFQQSDFEVKTISTQKVFNTIVKYL